MAEHQDTFRGDDAALVASITALLALDAAGALVPHGVGGHARALLASAAARLTPSTEASAVATQPEGQEAAMFRNITWPKARDVGRIGDMSPSASMRVGFDSDNDVFVSVWGEDGGASVEFCTPGPGGGASSRTREALIALMVAIEADNAERPDRDWWARRNKPAVQAGGGK